MPRHDDDGRTDLAEINRIGHIISQLEEVDLELVEPPVAVWKGIEAALASSPTGHSPNVPPSREARSHVVVEYWIDGDDIVDEVGEGWAGFARDNGAPDIADPLPSRTLWSYMDRDEVRELWQLLVQRVRRLHAEARVPFRCDGPGERRWFEMTLVPEPDDRVHFRSVLTFEEPRSPIALLDPQSARDADATAVLLCSWCGRGHLETLWLDIEDLIKSARLLEREAPPPISYGICGSCRTEMSAELLVPGSTVRPAD